MEKAVIVTHAVVIAAWLRLDIDQLGYPMFVVNPCGITVLSEDPLFHSRTVSVLNDTAHLGE